MTARVPLGAPPLRVERLSLSESLAMATNGQSKVIGISLKDRAAIMPSGRHANAAYWFRHVGQHPVFADLDAAGKQLAATTAAISIPSPWDPFWFIDLCEACARGRQAGEQLALLLQQREWELLFDYCYRKAIS